MKKRANFGSKIGAVLAAAGSAVGLGNIWRFPTETGENGGGAFLLVYVLCVLLLGLPVMLSEFVIGRRSHANTAGAYQVLAPRTPWKWVGRLGVLTGFLILCYYAVVAGWTLEYTVAALFDRFSALAHSGQEHVFSRYFQGFVSDPVSSVAYSVLFLLLTHVVVVRGVQKGIERFSKIFMPVLFVLLLVLMVVSLLMPGAAQGLRFLFVADFSKINSDVVLSAMGQAFYSLSLGMGCLCTYASYFSRDTNLGRTALQVSVIDTAVAILAGLIIFPAVFSVSEVSPDAGPSLLFVTLPNIFQSAFGAYPAVAYGFSLLFYVLLVLATLTSTISLHEVVTAYLTETFGLSRGRAATCVTAGCVVLGSVCALSMGLLSDYRLGGMVIFDLFDYVTAKWMLPVAGLLICLFAGWRLGGAVVTDELTNGGRLRFPLMRAFLFLLRYVSPVLIILVFLNELGLLGWL